MSVDTVLDRSGNVRDMREVVVPRFEHRVFDEVPSEVKNITKTFFEKLSVDLNKYPSSMDNLTNLSILIPDKATLFEYCPQDLYIRIIESQLRFWKSINLGPEQLSGVAIIAKEERSLYESKIPPYNQEDVTNFINSEINNYLNPENSRGSIRSILQVITDFSVLYPEKDFKHFISEGLKGKILDSLQITGRVNSTQLLYRLEELKYIKLLLPELIPQIVPDLEELYDLYKKKHLEEDKNEPKKLFRILKSLAAFQILFSEKPEFTSFGLKLDSRTSLNVSVVEQVPEIERFET